MSAMRATRARRGGTSGDDGFVLLESIVAIALITVLMVALTSLFISAMQGTAHQRATQGAIRIATDEIDQARGFSAAGALAGRDQSSVQQQFSKAPTAVLPWLSSSAVQAFDAAATAGAGAVPCPAGTTGTGCAALPTTPVIRTVSNIAYRVSFYEQWCHLGSSGGTPNCADANVATTAAVRQYLRVVVAIGWADSSCPAGGCSYVTSVMLSTGGDPLFRFRTPPPPAPALSGCAPQSSTAFDTVALDISGPAGICSLSGGVPPVTWAVSGLPSGLAVIQSGGSSQTLSAGGIIGSPTVGGTFTATVTATDAFVRSASATFTWTVSYPPLVPTNPGSQASTVGAPIQTLALTASGGSHSATFTDPSATLPPGLTLANNAITGTPTVAGSFAVTLTANDQPANLTATVSFTWVVNGPPAVQPPPSTITAPGDTVRGQAVGSGGTPPYTYALQGAPSWMHIDPSTGALSGTADSTIADYPGIVIALTDSRGATAQSAPFTWSVFNIPTMVPPGDQTSSFGENVTLLLQTTCPAAQCTVTATNLPGWLSLDPSTGQLSGTAPLVQEFDPGITVTITDPDGFSASSQFNWVVGPQRTITSPGDQVWTAGVALSGTTSGGLQITGNCSPDAPCTFSLASNSQPLPPGLSLSSSGLITGTPSTAGTWPGIVVQVIGKVGTAGYTAAAPFTWTINPAPTLAAPGNQRTVLRASVSTQLTMSCASTPCTVNAQGLPPGLSISNSGLITGTASTAGVSTVTVTVTDKTGAQASRAFTWYVLGVAVPNVSIAKSSGSCTNNSRLTVNLADDVTGYSAVSALTFAVSGPITTSVTGSQLTITAPCAQSTTNTMTVTVTDSGGGAPSTSATAKFNITVTN